MKLFIWHENTEYSYFVFFNAKEIDFSISLNIERKTEDKIKLSLIGKSFYEEIIKIKKR